MRKINNAKPKFNAMEYVFKIPDNKGKIQHHRFIFTETLENGRLEYLNTKTKTFRSMTPERFSFLHKFNLVEETPIINEPQTPPKQVKTITVVNATTPNQNERKDTFNDLCDGCIRDLKKVPDNTLKISSSGRTALELIQELECAKIDSNSARNGLILDVVGALNSCGIECTE